MKVQNIFPVYSDPGHAWCKVPMRLLARMGLLRQVSTYSYMRGAHAYLEEDCDLSLFISAYRKQFDASPVFREYISRTRSSKIRSYARFDVPPEHRDAKISVYIPGLVPLH